MEGMATRELLTLRLQAPLGYAGMENPPFAGIPSPETAWALISAFVNPPIHGEKKADDRGKGNRGAGGFKNGDWEAGPSESDARKNSGDASGSQDEASLSARLAEGDEELFAFDEAELFVFDADEGPRVSKPLPPPRFYGRASRSLQPDASPSSRPQAETARAASTAPAPAETLAAPPEAKIAAGEKTAAGGPIPEATAASLQAPGEARGLPSGDYLFMQWRPTDDEELAEGIEWFAREAWWERFPTLGPFFVRRIAEDGKIAVQALRAIKKKL